VRSVRFPLLKVLLKGLAREQIEMHLIPLMAQREERHKRKSVSCFRFYDISDRKVQRAGFGIWNDVLGQVCVSQGQRRRFIDVNQRSARDMAMRPAFACSTRWLVTSLLQIRLVHKELLPNWNH
jgi:hypothetical protein